MQIYFKRNAKTMNFFGSLGKNVQKLNKKEKNK